MFKIFDSVIVTPLLIIFVNCMETIIFPDKWKMPNVCPVHKNESKNLKENYSPIELFGN